MDLDATVKRTPEEYVRMLSQVPEKHKTSVAQIMERPRTHSNEIERILKRITHLERGNTMGAFKAWWYGPGKDRIVPVETYKKSVLSHRPGHSIGLACQTSWSPNRSRLSRDVAPNVGILLRDRKT